MSPYPAGIDQDGTTRYRVDEEGNFAYEVAGRKPFSKIHDVCRILLALDYADLVRPDEKVTGENLHHLQAMTDAGLPPEGGTDIRVGAAGAEVSCEERFGEAGFPTSAHSIRYASLYHTLRRLARSELGLSDDDWREPDVSLKRIVRFLDLDPDRLEMDLRSVEHHVIGNFMRLDSSSRIEMDERWRSFLTNDELEDFDRVAGDLNRRYGYT